MFALQYPTEALQKARSDRGAHMNPAEDQSSSSRYSRRKVLRAIGATLVAAPIGHLLACGKDSVKRGRDAGGDISDASEGGDAQTTKFDAGNADVPWATGGAAAMTGAANYPNPFANGRDVTARVR
jgi:hypothetical protein